MMSPTVMDRLICGDVGYGKTEVAIRAAFKAVNDGKQVAVLVPTTVLAQQHYNTFVERFQPYGVRVDMLSRFCTPKQQKETTEGLKNGTVDMWWVPINYWAKPFSFMIWVADCGRGAAVWCLPIRKKSKVCVLW